MNVIKLLQRLSISILVLGFVFLFGLTYTGAYAQVLNEYASQPDVWHPNGPVQPGVDAKGDLTLSIPVMTVPGRGGLDFDISFNYRSGVRVDQRASWIGTGVEF